MTGPTIAGSRKERQRQRQRQLFKGSRHPLTWLCIVGLNGPQDVAVDACSLFLTWDRDDIMGASWLTPRWIG